jgi:hypothetical protein
MAEFRKCLYAFALVALIAGLTVPASAQQNVVCVALGNPNALLRAEGWAEQTGDITMDCTGGNPTATGSAVPQVNVTVKLNTNVTSALTLSTANLKFSEALLILDEPNTYRWSPQGGRPVLNCGAPGAPDNSPDNLGPGICSIVAPGDPSHTYDGTPNGWVTAGDTSTNCDGDEETGRPVAGTYGCGRPNVFQGRQLLVGGGGTGTFSQVAIEFRGVPFDPPGTVPILMEPKPPNCDPDGTCHRTIRITNMRADAHSLGLGGPKDVLADISFTNNTFITLANPNGVVVGRTDFSLKQPTAHFATFIGCRDEEPDTPSVTFEEVRSEAWKPKNIAQLYGNHQSGDTTSVYIMSSAVAGGTYAAYPPDLRQNVPGATYNTETGFMNDAAPDAATSIPTPNPPWGLGTPTPPPPNDEGFSSGTYNTNTGIVNAGKASHGTRFLVNLRNVFAAGGGAAGDVVVRVPRQINLTNVETGGVTGVVQLAGVNNGAICCTPNGEGGHVSFGSSTVAITLSATGQCLLGDPPATDAATDTRVAAPGSTCYGGYIVYEVVFSTPFARETFTIPFSVSFTAIGLSQVAPLSPSPVSTANGGYAPYYSSQALAGVAHLLGNFNSGGFLPIPRFDGLLFPRELKLFQIAGKCTCSLLFPYATDGVIPYDGNKTWYFDSSFAIVNTSYDPGSSGPPNSTFYGFTGIKQQGPVQLWYYSTDKDSFNLSGSPDFGNLGNGAQGNTQCSNTTTPGLCPVTSSPTNVPPGGVLTFSLKDGSTKWGLLGLNPNGGTSPMPVDPNTGQPKTFEGYVIAQTSFQYCHGVAYVSTYSLALLDGLQVPSLSYLALQLDDVGIYNGGESSNNGFGVLPGPRNPEPGEGLIH